MSAIVLTEFQKLRRYHILLIGMIGMALSPVLGIVTQNVAIEQERDPFFDFAALVNSTIWNNATIFMPVIFTLIGGYLINREYEDDTLKNILIIPVSFSKLLAGKLFAMALLSILLGFYSVAVTLLTAVFAGLSGISAITLADSLFSMIGISICIYIVVLPIIAFCGKVQGMFMGGAIIAFVLGYCSMFMKSGILRNLYPFLAPFTVIGFDTARYTGAEGETSVPLGAASLGAMFMLAVMIILFSPEHCKIRKKKNNIKCYSVYNK